MGPAPRSSSRFQGSTGAWRVALVYAIVGLAWIAFSDRALARLIPDPGVYAIAQTFKGWAFVAVSAALVFILVMRELRAQRHAAQHRLSAEGRMRQAADQVYAMIHSSPLAVIVLGLDGTVALWNAGAERIFGWSADEAIGQPPLFVPEAARAEYTGLVRRVESGESLAGIEVVRQRKDGRPVHVRLWTAPLQDERGQLMATFAMIEDMTARREAEEILARRDAVLAAVGAAAAELLDRGGWREHLGRMVQDLGQALDTSRAYLFEMHTGPRGEPVISQRHEWCAPGITPQINNPELQNIPRQGSPFTPWGDALEQGEVVRGHAWQFPDAEQVFLVPEQIRSILLVPVFAGEAWWGLIGFDECTREREWAPAEIEAARAAAGLLGAVIERERASRALEASQDRYRRLVDNAPDAIFRYRLFPDRGFEYVSPAMTALIRYAPDELYADPDLILEMVHPDDRPRLLRILEGQVSAAGALQMRWQRRDGRVVWVEQQTSPVVDEVGRLVALEGIARDVTRRVEAEAAERRRADQLAGLYQTSLEMSARLGLEPLLQAIVERAARLVGTSMGSLYLVTPDGASLEQVVDLGGSGRYVGMRLALGEGASGRAAASGEPFMVEDHRHWDGRAAAYRDSTTGRVLAVPLKTQGNTLGVLALSDHEPGTFGEDEIRVSTLFAEQAAIALLDARLLEEARAHASEMEALVATALEISGQMDLDRLLASIVDRAADLLGLPVGGLYLLDDATQTLEMVVSRYPGRDYAGTRIAVGEGAAGRAVALDRPFFTESYADWEGKAPVYDDVRLGRVLAVPLRVGGRITGAVYVSDFERGVFTPAEIRLVSLFADQAAVAIENSRLLASERQRATDQARSRALMESLSRLAAKLERSTDPDELLETLRRELQALNLRFWLGVIDPASGKLHASLVKTSIPELAALEEILRQASAGLGLQALDTPLFRDSLREGKPQILPLHGVIAGIVPPGLLAEYGGRLEAAIGAGPEARVIALPLVRADRPGGLLLLLADELRPEDVTPLSVFGSQVSVALEKAELLDETRRRASYLEALASVATALRVAQDREGMQPIILSHLLQLLDAQGAALTLRDTETGGSITVLATGAWASSTGLRLGPGEGIVGQVLDTGVPKVSPDIRSDPALARRELFREIPAIACVPLIVQHETLGCLMVGRRTPFRDEDVRLLTAIAEMAGNALHRAGLMETLEERVQNRTRELEDANARLQELDRLKTDFVSNVTHELRTPITNILLYLDLLRMAASSERSVHYQSVLRSESVRLGKLIEDLLTLSRLERGAVSVESEPHPLDALLAEVLVAQTPSAQGRGITLTHEPNLDLPVVMVSRTLFLQVLTNLVGNAIAYGRPDGRVQVSTERRRVGEKDFVGVRVFNDGPAIDPEDMPHIFERFYRGRTGRESGQPGTGLGLPISKDIIERHGGWIEVESGRPGTTFTAWVPAAGAG